MTLARSSIVPPRLLHFEPAKYPKAAEQLGIEATVVLQLTVDTGGRVQRVEVREAAGRGFDEAAVAAAEQFIFEPASRVGVVVAAKILYRYRFELLPSAPLAEGEKRAVKPRNGELRGRIIAGTPPAPLVGIPVRILKDGIESVRIVTAADGRWVAPNLLAGEYAVEVTTSGYRRIAQLEGVAEGRVTAVTYTLETSDELPLEVTVRGVALQREVTHYELPRTELLRVPGTFGDALHAVEAMPSVARPPGLSGVLLVRGSAPQDTQVHIEGTPVPYVFHIGGLSSVVPGEMLERVELYPSNFSVRYGRAMGGIVEVRLRQTNPDDKFHGSAQMDLINARANAEGPVPRMPHWSFMGGLRASYMDRWLVPMLRDGGSSKDGLPRYYDYQLYLERRLPGNGVYRIGFVGAHDVVVPIERNPVDWRVPEENSFGHLQSQLRLALSPGIDLKASWSLGANRNSVFEDGRSYASTYRLATLRAEMAFRTGSVGVARFGVDLLYAPFSIQAQTQRPTAGGELGGGSIDAPLLRPYDIRGIYLRPAGYVEYELAPSRRINVVAGTRIDHTKDTSQTDVAPRLAARFVLFDRPMSTVLKAGLGWFFQPPDPRQTLPDLGTRGLMSSKAMHTMFGFEQVLTKHVTLSVEGFEKELRRLLTTHEDGSGNETTQNSGRGRVWGVDLLLRYHADARFFGWAAYTLSRSTRRSAADEPELLYRYDQTHVLNLLGSYRLGRGWEVGGRLRAATGTIYKACSGGIFDNATGDYRCYGRESQKRLAPYHQLDLRVEKLWDFVTWRLSAYVDVINAYYHHSPDKAVPRYDFSETKPLSLSLPFIPSIGVRGEI